MPVYRGRFGTAEAERLLWRAGFGPGSGDVERFAAMGMDRAVRALTRPAARGLQGPPPRVDGAPLAPGDAWGHDVLWWLDKMVRSQAPLVERMTLVWHDWFATSADSVETRWMLRQNQLFRRRGLGSFRTLLRDVTKDPAMLIWLNGNENNRWAPNENYARELQELFCLGAGRGYTERDVREIARALTGWTSTWSDGVGNHAFRYDRSLHDPGVKRIYGRRGHFDWRDVCDLVIDHRDHPGFFVLKLWSYFVPVAPDGHTARALQRLYVRSGHQIRPVVEAILRHPAFYTGPRMVKPPVVYVAGLLRALGRPIDTADWAWILPLAGQMPFYPPNVSGWDDTRWLDTSTWRGHWWAANYALEHGTLDTDPSKTPYPASESPEQALDRALAFWGRPGIGGVTRDRLVAFGRQCDGVADEDWKRETYPILRQNALRILLATSPDLMTS